MIRPLGKRLVVERAGSIDIAGREVTEHDNDGNVKLSSGLFVPASCIPAPQEVRVKAVGPKVKNFQVGDKVYLQRNCLRKVEASQGQERLILVDEDDILAKVTT